MNREEATTPIDDLDPERDCLLPRHPFFEIEKDQASFVGCIDAIDRVRAVIELCDFLELGDEQGGLTPRAEFGYYWINVLIQSTLSYVSKRLVVLQKLNEESHQEEANYLKAMARSLSSLGHDNQERFLDNTANQLDITRSALDQFVSQKAEQ